MRYAVGLRSREQNDASAVREDKRMANMTSKPEIQRESDERVGNVTGNEERD